MGIYHARLIHVRLGVLLQVVPQIEVEMERRLGAQSPLQMARVRTANSEQVSDDLRTIKKLHSSSVMKPL